MIKLNDGQITDLLPEKIAADTDTQCLSYAIMQEHQRLLYHADCTRTLSVIDELPERILDVLAVELRTPYYQESMDLATKRNIIQRTLLWHTKAGTPSAVAELIEVIFGEGSTVEWFNYDEPPYTPGTFDIVTNARMTEEITEYFLSVIQRVKNTRSHIRRILIERQMGQHEYVATAVIGSPNEAIMNHSNITESQSNKERMAAGVVATPNGAITNAPKIQSGITSDETVAVGASGRPHETIGNNVDPRTGQASGGCFAFAGMTASTKTVIYNGAFVAGESIKGTQMAAAAGLTSHSKITI